MVGWTQGSDMIKNKEVVTNNGTQNVEFMAVQPGFSELKYFQRVFFNRKIVIFGLVVILLLIVTAIFANFLAPYDPYKTDVAHQLAQPSMKHFLGTDALGRDTLSRIIYGSRVSLMVGVAVVFIAAFLGMTLGLIAGYVNGIVNTIIMRLTDAMMAIPMILLALVIAALLGGGLKNIIIALGIGLIPGYARLMCGQVLSVKQNDYITAAKSIGASNLRIMIIHILKNCFPPLIVMMTMMLGMAILAEAGLSFLGIGIEAPEAAWGSMISDGYRYLLTNPILSIAPGTAVMLVVFSFNLVGDGLRDALDPKLRGRL
jgi:peptide/nickel transport system permease protein